MPYLMPRDALADAKATLGSWDKCMEKTYCKWPVIVAIIVGSLIILSVVLCVARCMCCGAECACCCFRCCAGCCGSGRSSGHKRVKSESMPPPPVYANQYQQQPPYQAPYQAPPAHLAADTRPPNQQYRSHAAPTFNPAPEPEKPQYARFENTSKPANEDALPPMPTWSEATDSHVEEPVQPEKRGDMEMGRLNYNGSATGSSSGATAIAGARRSPGNMQQRPGTEGSYGFPGEYQNDAFANQGMRNSPGPQTGPYAPPRDGYRGMSPAPTPALSPVYGGVAGYAQNQQFERRSPNPGYAQQPQYDQPLYDQTPESPVGYGYRAQSPPQAAVNMPYPDTNYDRPSPVPTLSPQPQYTAAPAAASYPGQQAYQPPEAAYPGQQSYQAFNPSQGPQGAGVAR